MLLLRVTVLSCPALATSEAVTADASARKSSAPYECSRVEPTKPRASTALSPPLNDRWASPRAGCFALAREPAAAALLVDNDTLAAIQSRESSGDRSIKRWRSRARAPCTTCRARISAGLQQGRCLPVSRGSGECPAITSTSRLSSASLPQLPLSGHMGSSISHCATTSGGTPATKFDFIVRNARTPWGSTAPRLRWAWRPARSGRTAGGGS